MKNLPNPPNTPVDDDALPASESPLTLLLPPERLSLLHSVYERAQLPHASEADLCRFTHRCIDTVKSLQEELGESQHPLSSTSSDVWTATKGSWRQKRESAEHDRAKELENDRLLLENLLNMLRNGMSVADTKMLLEAASRGDEVSTL